MTTTSTPRKMQLLNGSVHDEVFKDCGYFGASCAGAGCKPVSDNLSAEAQAKYKFTSAHLRDVVDSVIDMAARTADASYRVGMITALRELLSSEERDAALLVQDRVEELAKPVVKVLTINVKPGKEFKLREVDRTLAGLRIYGDVTKWEWS